MFSADKYELVYLIIVTLFTFFTWNRRNEEKGNLLGAIVLCIFLILYIGLRPYSPQYFVDQYTYNWSLQIAEWNGFDFNVTNLLFDNLLNYMGGTGVPNRYFYLLIAAIYFGCMLGACNKLFPRQVFLAFVVCLAAFSTFSYATNGIKAGAAASIFLLAIAYADNLLIAILLALISWGFHHSMQLPVAAFIIALLFRKDKYYFIGWGVCFIISILHITYFQRLFAGMTDEVGADYLNTVDADFVQHKGFRYDFVVYSIFPLIMGWYAIFKYKFADALYGIILRTYIFTNAIWLLCMYAPFTNRISYLSWSLYPVALIYPCFKNTQLSEIKYKVVWLHLAFTLFMYFIYY